MPSIPVVSEWKSVTFPHFHFHFHCHSPSWSQVKRRRTKEVKNPAPYVQHVESKKEMVSGTKETACRWVGCSTTQVNGLRFRGSCGLEFWRPFIRRLWYPREEKKWQLSTFMGHGWEKVEWMRREVFVRPARCCSSSAF